MRGQDGVGEGWALQAQGAQPGNGGRDRKQHVVPLGNGTKGRNGEMKRAA